jgi:ferrochelatase
MKHWHPYIREVLPQIVNDGFRRIIAVALAPHYSQISIGGYKRALDEASADIGGLVVNFVESWYDNPLFIRAVAERVNDALAQFGTGEKVEVLFTAHSLPERILQNNDQYPSQLYSSCQAVANALKLDHWSFSYQSAGETGEKWLGPDILEALQKIGTDKKGSDVIAVPIGFVADHLEILYDIDVEAQEVARKLGQNLKRTQSLNTNPTFVAALADIVLERANSSKWS